MAFPSFNLFLKTHPNVVQLCLQKCRYARVHGAQYGVLGAVMTVLVVTTGCRVLEAPPTKGAAPQNQLFSLPKGRLAAYSGFWT